MFRRVGFVIISGIFLASGLFLPQGKSTPAHVPRSLTYGQFRKMRGDSETVNRSYRIGRQGL
jgi:hypothetical protein